MFKFNGFAAAAAFVATGLTVASVASAQPLRPVSATILTPMPASMHKEVVTGERRVCVVGDSSTALPRKVCHRYAEWLDAGVDPLADRRS